MKVAQADKHQHAFYEIGASHEDGLCIEEHESFKQRDHERPQIIRKTYEGHDGPTGIDPFEQCTVEEVRKNRGDNSNANSHGDADGQAIQYDFTQPIFLL